jgi:hypothetical protein
MKPLPFFKRSAVFSLFIFVNLFSQPADRFLATIPLEKIPDLQAFEALALPIYHQFDNILIAGVSGAGYAELQLLRIPFTIIDRSPWDQKYYIITSPAGKELHLEGEWGNVLYKNRHSALLKTPALPAEALISKRYRVSEMPPVFTCFKNERRIPAPPTISAAQSIIQDVIAEINSDSIEYFIQSLQDFQTRFLLVPNRDSVAAWIKYRFERMGYSDVKYDSFLCYTNYAQNDTTTMQKSVVATLPGTTYPDFIYIIGGHYDSFSYLNPMVFAPGADDNASGTAVALEVARAIKEVNYQPAATIKFIAFGAEELMLFGDSGSEHFAQAAYNAGMDIKLMINNDMISHTARPLPDSRVDINYYTGFEYLRDIALYLTGAYTAITAVPGSLDSWSDSYPFWYHGYPAIYFEEDDFSPYYHTPDDIITNYSMEFCAEVIKASGALLIYMIEFPAPVGEFTARDYGNGNSLQLTWAHNPEPDIAGYFIYFGESSGVYDTVYTTTDTTYIIDNLTEGVEYFAGITAFDADDNESLIVERSAVPYTIPLPPVNLCDFPRWLEVLLTWSPNLESDLLGYNVYRADSSGGTPVKLNTTIIQDTFFVDNTTANGMYYYYTTRAVDNDLHESETGEEIRSRAVSLDQGILIVDYTADGNGTPLNPTDQQVDDFYNALLSDFSTSGFDVYAENGIKLADLGAYSSVLWHTNDLSALPIPANSREGIKKYLDYGGNLLISSYLPSKVFSNNFTYPATFSGGDFMYDYFQIADVDLRPPARFYGAYPVSGNYDSVYVDTVKTASIPNRHLIKVEKISAAPNALDIYGYDSEYSITTPQGSMKGLPVGVEYPGANFKAITLSFPLYFMDFVQAKTLVTHVMLDKFFEVTPIGHDEAPVADRFVLFQNYPNPFNPATTIRYTVPKTTRVTLRIYNLLGQEIRTLINTPQLPGEHSVTWNGADNSGRKVSSGIYIYRIEAGDYRESRKMVILR